MTRQHTPSRDLKAAAMLAGTAALIVGLEQATGQLNHFVGAGAWGLLGILHCVVPTAIHALQACALDYGRWLQCPVQMLVSSWPLLAVVAAAI